MSEVMLKHPSLFTFIINILIFNIELNGNKSSYLPDNIFI